MLTKKTLSIVAALSAVALALTACGGSADNGSSADAPKEVTIWTLTQQESQKEAWTNLVTAFNEEFPEITIITEERATDAHKDALRQAAGTDSGPDVYRYWGGSGLGGELVRVGMSEDITDLYEEYGWADVLTPSALSYATQYEGHHGVPFIQATEAVFYNKRLFAEAGITEIPATYDELVAAAGTLKDAGVIPMAFGGTVNWHVMRLLDSLIETKCGAEKADELTQGDGNWGEEACVTEAFTELKMWGENYLNEGFMAISNDDSSQLIYSGQAAMSIEGDWFGPMAIDGGLPVDEIGLFPFPTGTGRTYGFGELMYLTPNAKNPDAAAKFLDFMVSEEGQAQLGNAFSSLSVNANVTPAEGTPLAAEWMELIAASTGSFINNDQNFGTAETGEFWRVQNSVLTGDIDPADAGAEFQTWRDANK